MERLRLPTYRQVWTLERVIYKIEGVRLPVAVNFRQVGIFLVSMLIMVPLSRVPVLSGLAPSVRYILIPVVLTWYLTKQSLDGKPPHLWLWSMIRYWFGPRRLVKLQPVRTGRRRHSLNVSLFVRLSPGK